MQILKCYLAGALFSLQDRRLLEELAGEIERRRVAVYLPHRDGGDLGTVVFNRRRERLRGHFFDEDLRHVKKADFVVALLDGQDSDSGTCVEIGIAYAAGQPIFGLKTDLERRGSVVNNMVWGVCDSGKRLFTEVSPLLTAIDAFVRRPSKKRGLT